MNVAEDKPTILFATVAVGGGHVATARAMSEAIERYYPGRFDLPVSDYMEDLGVDGIDRRHKAFWRCALRYPTIARTGQRLIDTFPRTTVAGQRLLVREFSRTAADVLKEEPPLLIVSNHGLITSGLVESKRLYGLKVPVLTYATEPYNISAYWADPLADHIVVPSQDVRKDLVNMGVPADRVAVVSYPVRQPFLNAPSKTEARERLGLENRFTALVSLGGEGLGGDPRWVIQALLNSELSPQTIVITGRNKALSSSLRRLQRPGLRVEGFVEDMASYLAASDVIVGKGGPASVYEALAVGRPVLATRYAGLNELGVVRFVEREGFGRYVKTPATLLEAIEGYASDPNLLEEVAHRSEQLELTSKTEALAHYIVRYALNGGTGA